jgi:glutathione peroxidase
MSEPLGTPIKGQEAFQIPFTLMNGDMCCLADLPARAYLIVNTASQCGFTSQYERLELLWRTYRSQGLVVLAFPCDQFGHQEPGSNSEIASFCATRFDISFPVSQKIEVNGSATHPLFRVLKKRAPGLFGTLRIKWNFTKFLVSGDGALIKRFAPIDKLETLEQHIKQLL